MPRYIQVPETLGIMFMDYCGLCIDGVNYKHQTNI
jgi:hypothetical protein